jgi:hypothetical protein
MQLKHADKNLNQNKKNNDAFQQTRMQMLYLCIQDNDADYWLIYQGYIICMGFS